MVGRFIQKQQVRLRHQRPGEQHPAAPSAGERVDDGIGRQAEPREDHFHPLLEAPAVALVQFVLEPAEAIESRRGGRFGDGHRGVVVRLDEIAEIAESLGHHVEDGEMLGQGHVLIQPGRPQIGLAPDGAAIGPLLAAQHAEQRRLAAAIAAEHTHPLPRLDLRADVVEERQVAEGERHAIEGQQRHVITLEPVSKQR